MRNGRRWQGAASVPRYRAEPTSFPLLSKDPLQRSSPSGWIPRSVHRFPEVRTPIEEVFDEFRRAERLCRGRVAAFFAGMWRTVGHMSARSFRGEKVWVRATSLN